MPLIALFIIIFGALSLNDFLGLFQTDSIYFWKNTESKAKEVSELLSNRKVLSIPQQKIFDTLNGKLETVSDVKNTQKLKDQLLNSTVEWVFRVEEVRKFGSRYQIITKNESPLSNEYEELGRDLAKAITGDKNKGNVISFCGSSYVYPQSPEVEKYLDNLKDGDIIRLRGIVDRFEWQADPFGIMQTLSKLSWLMSSEKEKVGMYNCPILRKAILTKNQDGKEYSLYSNETREIFNRGNVIKEGIRKGVKESLEIDNQ